MWSNTFKATWSKSHAKKYAISDWKLGEQA